ncbi:MAG: hypothetical protein IIU80_04655 [Clostridia bacterium]|nr:hypothetical protein [Clostridia bacterium]
MKKTLKTILSIILSVAMIFAVCIPAFASEEKTAFVVVSGMNTFPLRYSDGEQAFPPTSDSITPMVLQVIPPVLSFLATNDYDALADGIFPPLEGMFGALAFDEDGNSINDIDGTLFDHSLVGYEEPFVSGESNEFATVRAGIDTFGLENTYFFNYDWRKDPLVHADRLNAFIEKIKTDGDYDRIVLACFSMGGTVTCSYLYKYGSDDLDTIIMCSTAFQGTSCVGSLFSADFSLTLSALWHRLALLTRDNTWTNVIDYLDVLLEQSGVNGGLEAFANSITDNLKERIYDELLIPVFGRMPGLWALVPDENYADAKACMLNGTESKKLVDRIDEYHYNVQCEAENLLKSAMDNDTNVYVLAQYNWPSLPISESVSVSNTDNLIDVEYASGGATSALLEETLGDDYVQAENDGHDHISPDNQIDASTCMLPDQTWFFRDMGHVDYPYGESTDFIMWLATSEKQLTVYDNEQYPQFMTYDYDNAKLMPLTEEAVAPTTADIIFNVLEKITEFIFKLTREMLAAVIK